MAQTQLRGKQVLDGSVQREDLDVSTPGSAVIRKIIAGTNVTLSFTGADSGTGDVTINVSAAAGSGKTSGQIEMQRLGAVLI
jgi:hypothetical protein